MPLLTKAPGTERGGVLWVPWRHKSLIARTAAVVFVVATAVSFLLPQTYQATSTILLEPSFSSSQVAPNSGSTTDPEWVVQTEIQVVLSQQVRDIVRQQVQDATAVTVVPSGRTDVIEITARSKNRLHVADVANAYSTAYIYFRRNMAAGDLRVVQDQLTSKISTLQLQIDATSTQADAARRGALINQQSALQLRLDDIQVGTAIAASGGTVLSRATPPTKAAIAVPLRNAVLSLLFGLVAGVVLAMARDRWFSERRVRHVQEP